MGDKHWELDALAADGNWKLESEHGSAKAAKAAAAKLHARGNASGYRVYSTFNAESLHFVCENVFQGRLIWEPGNYKARDKQPGAKRGGPKTERRWVSFHPELGLLWPTADQNRFGTRQNLRRQFYPDKPNMTWDEIVAEGWTEVRVKATFTVPKKKSCPSPKKP